MLGVYSDTLVRPVAEVLRELGSEHAWVVHGRDGLDELTVFGKTHVAELKGQEIREFEVDPSTLGFGTADRSGIAGGDPAANAAKIRAIFSGEQGPARDIVVLNTAAALIVSGLANDLAEGIERAQQAIDRGAAQAKLAELAAFRG